MRKRALATRAACLFGLSFLSACAAQQAYEAAAGRAELIGFTEREIRMCAGLPQRTWNDDGTAIWSYELDSKDTGGLTLNSPVLYPPFGAGLSMGGNQGYCRMQVRFSGGKAVEVAFAGDTDVGPARNAVCAPIVRGCLRYARPGHPALPAEERLKAEKEAAQQAGRPQQDGAAGSRQGSESTTATQPAAPGTAGAAATGARGHTSAAAGTPTAPQPASSQPAAIGQSTAAPAATPGQPAKPAVSEPSTAEKSTEAAVPPPQVVKP